MISVIFDMDGTLLDTQKIVIPAWEHAGLNQGFSGIGEHVKRVCGMNEAGWSKYLTEHVSGIDVVRFNREFREYVKENGKIRFRPGAEKLMKFLDDNSIKYAIASGSSMRSVEHHLKEVGVFEKFSAFACGSDVKNGKPAPDIFLLAARRLGVSPGECIVFEDSANGVLAGHAAGMRVIGFADIAPFSRETEKYMFAQIRALDEAVEILKNL